MSLSPELLERLKPLPDKVRNVDGRVRHLEDQFAMFQRDHSRCLQLPPISTVALWGGAVVLLGLTVLGAVQEVPR